MQGQEIHCKNQARGHDRNKVLFFSPGRWDISPDYHKKWGSIIFCLDRAHPIHSSLTCLKKKVGATLYYSSSFYETDNMPVSSRKPSWWTGTLPEPRVGKLGRGKMK